MKKRAMDPEQPQVSLIPGAQPSDGHEHFWSPRNIIAFAIVAAFIGYSFMPYLVGTIADGRAGDLIISNGKVIETIVVLIIGFFFGTTVGASRVSARQEARQDVLTAAAAAAPLVAPVTAAGGATLHVEAPATIDLKETADALGPDAPGRTEAPAAPVDPPRPPGRGPPE